MAYKFFRVAWPDPAAAKSELNGFLRSHRVMKFRQQSVEAGEDSFWSFCVESSNSPRRFGRPAKRRPPRSRVSPRRGAVWDTRGWVADPLVVLPVGGSDRLKPALPTPVSGRGMCASWQVGTLSRPGWGGDPTYLVAAAGLIGRFRSRNRLPTQRHRGRASMAESRSRCSAPRRPAWTSW